MVVKFDRSLADLVSMENSGRKSSDDLIREANQRLRGAGGEQGETSPSEVSAPVEVPAADTAPPAPSAPQELVYRSQSRADEDHLGIQVPPVDDRQQSWISPRLIRWVLTAIVFGGIYLFTTFGDASRDGSGEIAGAGDLEVMSLQAGDCFNDPEDFDEVVFDVAAVPCSEPHDNEAFAVQSLAAAFPGDAFPGPDVLWEHAYEICSGPLFDSYVGTPFLDSALDVFSFTPSSESWDQGDREFVCAVYRLDLAQLTGTARGSGL